MKRTWIGAGLLAALLLAGLLMGSFLETRLGPGKEKLRQAADAALAGNWEKAEDLTGSVRAEWESGRCLAAGLATHDILEQIGTGFELLSTYAGTDGTAYAALCTELAHELEALAKSHRWSWENFF